MRPLRLELEGFTSFKERLALDFDGLDLFAITGPTGAGKSSLIDALVFALYGQVPRVGRGAAKTPTYVNLTGERVVPRSAPMVDGACTNTNADAVQETGIPAEDRAEIAEACWCCASADEKACKPGNKTGLGRALLVKCFE